MNHEKYRKYIYWGVTAFLVCGLVALMVFLMINWKKAEGIMALLKDILAPIIYGAVFAYLMTPIYNRVQGAVIQQGGRMKLSKKTSEKLGAFAATIVSLVVLIAVVTGLISMLIPQLLTSIRGIIEALPSNIA